MRNGIYLALIVFLGTFAYTVVGRVGDTLEAGFAFLLASIAIGFLTTHFKKRTELLPVQKVINVVAIGIFALFGIAKGLSLVSMASIASLSSVVGIMFFVSSLVLVFSLTLFMREKVYHIDEPTMA